MTAAYSSSWSFGSRVGSKYIGHDTYIVRRSNFHSKPTLINGPFIDMIWIIHTREFPLVVCHKQLIKNNLLFVSES